MLSGVVVGVGLFGLFTCLCDTKFDLGNVMVYLIVMIFGIVGTMVSFD